MKTSQHAAVTALALALGVLAAPRASAQIPAIPVGSLTAFPSVVQTGTKPTLTWNILYPSKVSDMALVKPPGTLIFNQTGYVSVQIVGTGVSSGAGSPTPGSTTLTTDVRLSLSGSAYVQLFYGTQADVDPVQALYTKKIGGGQTIDFGGRYVENGSWSPFYTTTSANQQVVALLKGDLPPTTFPLSQQSNLANYLKPYLDATGRVNIGPLSVLILMELNQTNHTQKSFDLQDQVLLVTLSLKHPNNGHGNNLDGVDCSNPGGGHGGPNGMIDPSGGVDDEMR